MSGSWNSDAMVNSQATYTIAGPVNYLLKLAIELLFFLIKKKKTITMGHLRTFKIY